MTKTGNILNFPERSQIDEAAARWVVRLEEPGASDETILEFEAWRAASVLHQEAFARLQNHWGELDGLRAAGGQAGGSKRRPAMLAGAAIAAALVVGVVLAGAQLMLPQPGSGTQLADVGVYETPVGGQETVELADGSTVVLNTASQIEVRYSDTERSVRLLEGEAFFDVAKDADRPFRVYAGSGMAAALGTAFSVRLHDSEIELVVAEGRVSYASVAKAVEPIAFVSAGQSATFSERVNTIETVDVAEVNRKLAWREGRLVFAGDPLSSVVADIARYTEVTIEIADPNLQNMAIGGVFEVGNVDSMLDLLETGFQLRVERVSDSLVRISGNPS